MKSERSSPATQKVAPWQWREGPVDKRFDHFELRYGDASASGEWDAWIPVAIVGLIHQDLVNVEFVIDSADPRNFNVAEDAVKELNFYLGKLNEPDPWHYLQYHCGTASNVYSAVHWSFMRGSAKSADPRNGKSLPGALWTMPE